MYLYPFAVQTDARPIPVLSLVGSIMTVSWCMIPFFSASSIIDRATLSLTDPVGLKYSA